MKKIVALLTAVLFAFMVRAQEAPDPSHIAIKWAPAGLALGSLNLHAEYNFGKSSLTAKIGIPVSASQTITYDGKDADFNMKATSFLAGYRTYLSKKHMRGLYFEPYFKYVHHTSEGRGTGDLSGRSVIFDFTNDYNGVGVGAQLGAQFLIGNHFVIDLFFLGPEINSARNNFKAVEASNLIPWSNIEASDAERDIRDFIDDIPFIRNKTTVMVDKNNHTVAADFKGALPGFRAGLSIGFAF
ncbi:MAG TPA: hypothetical protein VHK91_14355 [Flavisolibacter sp.]|jgi:hypothetical protein|nr:hypothetical protein [Flavisolibacter sp.]